MSIFTGSAVALVTPFLENGDVDYDKLKELVEFHIAHNRRGFNTVTRGAS